MRYNRLLGMVLAVFLLAVSACGGGGEDKADAAAESGSGQESPSAPAPDLEGVPEIVAEVNGEEIAKDEFVETYQVQFQQMAQQSQTPGGEEVDQDQLKKQVVESMVSTELLVQEADDRSFSASQKQVDQMLQELAEQNGLGSVEKFLAALEKQGMEGDEVRSQVEVQLQVEQLVADEAGDLRPTEREVRALYKQMAAQGQAGGAGGQKVPPYEKLRPQLVEQLKSQETAAVAQKLVADLRKDADVVINL